MPMRYLTLTFLSSSEGSIGEAVGDVPSKNLSDGDIIFLHDSQI